jgi:hypothetical protein
MGVHGDLTTSLNHLGFWVTGFNTARILNECQWARCGGAAISPLDILLSVCLSRWVEMRAPNADDFGECG